MIKTLLSLICLVIQPATASETTWGLESIHAHQAVDTPVEPVIVAVIDTGAELSHPALRDHLWTNPGETGVDGRGHRKESNAIDDEANGYIDDVHGWNFVDHQRDVTDHHGHGTHIAGLIAAVAPNAQLMILKYYDPNEVIDAEAMNSTTRAIEYARRQHARIINYSAGGPAPNPLEAEAIARAGREGIVMIAAAGNDAHNNDYRPFYPASYELANLLAVTATSPRDLVLKSSNFGARSVGVAAPGEDLLSSLPGGRCGPMTGTSQATALVSGVAALALGADPSLRDPAVILAHIVNSGRYSATLTGKTRARKIVDAYRVRAIRDGATNAMGDAVAIAPGLEGSKLMFDENEPQRDVAGER